MSDVVRRGLWYASVSLQNFEIDWSTGIARKPKS